MPDVTPKTESGRALHGGHCRRPDTCDYLAAILAIEQEAASKAVAEWARLIVSYADLTHDVVRDPNGDWRDIATEWGKVVEQARALIASERKP